MTAFEKRIELKKKKRRQICTYGHKYIRVRTRENYVCAQREKGKKKRNRIGDNDVV